MDKFQDVQAGAQIYSDPSREEDPHALPDVEVFWADEGEFEPDGDEPSAAGWYYWACFPGCLPDSDPMGPYATKQEAIDAARED